MALHIYNQASLSAASKRTPEDVFSGDGLTQDFALVYVTASLLARAYVDENLKGTTVDFYTYLLAPTEYIHFYTAPLLGTSNIVVQTNYGLFFPGGTVQSGQLNAYAGDTVDVEYQISNDDSDKGYLNVTITPQDFIGTDEAGWVKLATTQGGLTSAVAGAALNIGSVLDSDTAHSFWTRMTVPASFLPPNEPALNKYDLSFLLAWAEYDL